MSIVRLYGSYDCQTILIKVCEGQNLILMPALYSFEEDETVAKQCTQSFILSLPIMLFFIVCHILTHLLFKPSVCEGQPMRKRLFSDSEGLFKGPNCESCRANLVESKKKKKQHRSGSEHNRFPFHVFIITLGCFNVFWLFLFFFYDK